MVLRISFKSLYEIKTLSVYETKTLSVNFVVAAMKLDSGRTEVLAQKVNDFQL